jgi:hypothetical protein
VSYANLMPDRWTTKDFKLLAQSDHRVLKRKANILLQDFPNLWTRNKLQTCCIVSKYVIVAGMHFAVLYPHKLKIWHSHDENTDSSCCSNIAGAPSYFSAMFVALS